MLTHLKINTAFLISMAFIFRLLFVNIGLLPSFGDMPANKCLTKHFSSLQKRKHMPESSVAPYSKDQTIVEVCEEDFDNKEDLAKSNSSVVLSFFDSLFKRSINSEISDNPFDAIKCNLYPKRYLALSILRI